MPESEYNGITGTATYYVNGKTFGPFELTVPEYHAIGHAIQEAKKEGAIRASGVMKEHIEATLQLVLNKY